MCVWANIYKKKNDKTLMRKDIYLWYCIESGIDFIKYLGLGNLSYLARPNSGHCPP